MLYYGLERESEGNCSPFQWVFQSITLLSVFIFLLRVMSLHPLKKGKWSTDIDDCYKILILLIYIF